jgi:hypothetical protein
VARALVAIALGAAVRGAERAIKDLKRVVAALAEHLDRERGMTARSRQVEACPVAASANACSRSSSSRMRSVFARIALMLR